MDPTTCYRNILDAIRSHHYQRAREYALILQNWLSSGGFPPQGYDFGEVTATLGRILRPACNASALRFPFVSITCAYCDAGQDIESLEQAIDEGWTRIDPEVDIPTATHIGVCHQCRCADDDEL